MRHEWCRDHKPTESKTLGTYLHKMLLEPSECDLIDGFEEFFTFAPGASLTSKEAVRHQEANPDKVMILDWMPKAARAMKNAIMADPKCSEIMCWQAEKEVSGYAWDETHQIMRKIRMDWMPLTGDSLADVKTCESTDELAYWRTCQKWDYPMKGAFYLDTDALITGRQRTTFIHIAVTSAEPHIARMVVLGPDMIEEGRKRYQERMTKLLHAHRTGNYDPYSDEHGYLLLTAQRPFSGGNPQV